MRPLMIATLAAAALGSAALTSSPAAAYDDYPYCLQGRQQGYPGDCNFTSFRQCKAAASGTNADCGINPRVAYGARPDGYGRRYYNSRAQW